MKACICGKSRSVIVSGIVICMIVCILVFSSASSKGIVSGLEYSSKLLIPSLFPFMVLSGFIIRSGISVYLGKLTAPLTTHVFRLPEKASAAVLLSFIGGFPVGAKCVRLLYDKGDINSCQAEQMMLFCICSGPAFLITGVGTIMLGNSVSGLILYVSQLLSGLILGILSGIIYRDSDMSESAERKEYEKGGYINDFICSCSDGAVSVINLVSLVVFFSMFLSVAEETGLSGLLYSLLKMLGADHSLADCAFPIISEVTTACNRICQGGCPLSMLSLAAGFGGLCVHFQIFALLGDMKVSRLKIIAFRFINAFLSSVITEIICCFYVPSVSAFALYGNEVKLSSATIAGTAALIIMCAVFLLSLKGSELKRTIIRK